MNEKQLNGYMEGYAAASTLSKEAGATAEVLKQLGAAGLGAGLGAAGDYAITGDVGVGAPVAGALAGSGAYNAYKYRKELAKMLGLGGDEGPAIEPADLPAYVGEHTQNKMYSDIANIKQQREMAKKLKPRRMMPDAPVKGLEISDAPIPGLTPETNALVKKVKEQGVEALSPMELSAYTVIQNLL